MRGRRAASRIDTEARSQTTRYVRDAARHGSAAPPGWQGQAHPRPEPRAGGPWLGGLRPRRALRKFDNVGLLKTGVTGKSGSGQFPTGDARPDVACGGCPAGLRFRNRSSRRKSQPPRCRSRHVMNWQASQRTIRSPRHHARRETFGIRRSSSWRLPWQSRTVSNPTE